MRRLSAWALVFALFVAAAAAATPPIQSEAVLAHIKFLASDELKGRASGSPELERAGDYIAAQFKAAGLRPGGANGNWFQPFELVAGLSRGEGNEGTVHAGSQAVHLTLGESYFPLAATPSESTAAASADLHGLPLVFAGYGITAPAYQYDDYAGVDVAGKAVLIFSHEPQENRRDSRLNGAEPIRETTLYSKALAARSHGARALVVVSDPSHRTDEANYKLFTIDSDAEDEGIPVLRVRRMEMAPLLAAWGLDRVAEQIDSDLMPRSRQLPGGTLDYTEHLAKNRRTVRNVVGILPGSDPGRADEAIVLGAHYDHVGLGGRFSSAPEQTGQIHNGADDNASGVASIIEIARAAAADRGRFQRSLVFVAFAGEERGLLGSAHYANNATFPVMNTIAMLNLDMVGRSNGKVEVGGMEKALLLETAVREAAQHVGVEARRSSLGAGRSDDASFLDKQIPSIHFFTGFHNDYHRPGDDWNKIDAPGTARVATLALEVAARLAATDERPAFASR
jgi:hypothetical protein